MNIKLKKDKYYIFNTSKPPHMGHFIALYLTQNTILEVFDSFGYRYIHLPKYITKQAKMIKIVCRKQLQSKYSHICSLYAIYFIYYRHNNYSIKQILKNFTHNVDSNDSLIFSWYTKNSFFKYFKNLNMLNSNSISNKLKQICYDHNLDK